MGELLVSIDLMAMGYEVFRNVSPHGKADLVIRRGNDVC